MYKKIIPVTLAGLILLAASACGGAPVNSQQPAAAAQVNSPVSTAAPAPDQPTGNQAAVPVSTQETGPRKILIADLNKNGAALLGNEVIVEGKIIQECGAGCWFNLQDSTGIIYVDLAPNNLVIPPKIGSKAKVYGKVDRRSNIIYIIGSKVEF